MGMINFYVPKIENINSFEYKHSFVLNPDLPYVPFVFAANNTNIINFKKYYNHWKLSVGFSLPHFTSMKLEGRQRYNNYCLWYPYSFIKKLERFLTNRFVFNNSEHYGLFVRREYLEDFKRDFNKKAELRENYYFLDNKSKLDSKYFKMYYIKDKNKNLDNFEKYIRNYSDIEIEENYIPGENVFVDTDKVLDYNIITTKEMLNYINSNTLILQEIKEQYDKRY